MKSFLHTCLGAFLKFPSDTLSKEELLGNFVQCWVQRRPPIILVTNSKVLMSSVKEKKTDLYHAK
jgi:hypothetical protein